ncbi:MAG: OmpA family protein [Cytophagaceae bacterium]|nr:OmpA family protein [Cytophagaceae bacterium]
MMELFSKRLLVNLIFIICTGMHTCFLSAQNVSANNTGLRATEKEVLFVAFVTDLDKVAEKGVAVLIKSEDKSVTRKGITDIDGRYVCLVPKGKKYMVTVTKTSYDFNFVSNVPNVKGPVEFVQNYVINLFLDFKRSYVLDAVYFDPGKAEIKPECFSPLDTLVLTFQNNSRFRAEIAGFTDNVGNDNENMRLSQRRADAIRDYLISKGVPAHRVLAKGYGEKFPMASNDTEVGRTRNRRTEVKVIQE